MSAWGIGRKIASHRRRTQSLVEAGVEATEEEEEVESKMDNVIGWIPGEVVTAYSALVLALQPTPDSADAEPELVVTSFWWLVFFGVAAGALTLFGALSKTRDLDPQAEKELKWSVGLAVVAFMIWSFVIAGSWWYSFDGLRENSQIVPIVAGIAGLAFGLVADGIMLRVKPPEDSNPGDPNPSV